MLCFPYLLTNQYIINNSIIFLFTEASISMTHFLYTPSRTFLSPTSCIFILRIVVPCSFSVVNGKKVLIYEFFQFSSTLEIITNENMNVYKERASQNSGLQVCISIGVTILKELKACLGHRNYYFIHSHLFIAFLSHPTSKEFRVGYTLPF